MQLPRANSQYAVRVRYGRYVARRLKRGGLGPLAEDVLHTTQSLRAAGRAVEDADDAVQDALADRDGADDDLDAATQHARNTLAGRAVHAVNEEPYTLIFDRGVGYYIAAPLDQETARYGELVERLEAHLPASDEVRRTAVKAVKKGLKDFEDATKALAHARSAALMETTKLHHATEKWERQLEKCYGLLVADLGKAAAERFFPRARTISSTATDEPVTTPTPAPAQQA
jgi:hypothetical protein